MSNDTFRVRATTHSVKDPKGLAGYVLKIKPEDVSALVDELSGQGYGETGATLFLNVYENESQYEDGNATYLSSTIGAQITEKLESKGATGRSGKQATSRNAASKSVNNFDSKIKSRR